jgi:hypothetical protein
MIPSGEPSTLALTESIRKNSSGRHFKNRMIYVTNNEAYSTFIPYLGYNADSLRYKFPNVPTFTFLKELDLFVEKLETSKKVYTKEEFVKKYEYYATDEFKDYHGKRVQKYVSKNDFYEMYFWVGEASGSMPSNDFIDILKELRLLTLSPNKEIVAINYLFIEFPMDFMVLQDRSRKSLNREVFEVATDETEENEGPGEKYKTVTNPDEIAHLLNKEYTFTYKQTKVQKSYMYRPNTDEQTVYLSDENSNSLFFIEKKFYAFIHPYVIWGNVDENENLMYVGSQKLIDKKEEEDTLDFSDDNILYMTTDNGIIDICIQKKNDFWNFLRFKIVLNSKEFANQKVDLILPNKKIAKALIKEEIAFRASYSGRRTYEFVTRSGEIQPLKTKKTYVIKK